MKKIFKYPLMTTDIQSLLIPVGAEILTVQVQGATPCIWALVNPELPEKQITVQTFGTGHHVDGEGKYIGTYQLEGGSLVFHVFIH